jgi:hypothetical protein
LTFTTSRQAGGTTIPSPEFPSKIFGTILKVPLLRNRPDIEPAEQKKHVPSPHAGKFLKIFGSVLRISENRIFKKFNISLIWNIFFSSRFTKLILKSGTPKTKKFGESFRATWPDFQRS